MTNPWDAYSLIFLSALVSLVIPALLSGVSFLLIRGKSFPRFRPKESVKQLSSDSGLLERGMSIKFFLSSNTVLLLLSLVFALIPCVTTLRDEDPEKALKGLVSVLTLAGASFLGLLYSIRKGDLGWDPSDE